MDSANDAALVVFLVNKWLADEGHEHFWTVLSSPTGPWYQCSCGATKMPEPGEELRTGPH
jgi:hypothetical protein